MEINDDISHFITGLVIFLIFIVVHQMQTNIKKSQCVKVKRKSVM